MQSMSKIVIAEAIDNVETVAPMAELVTRHDIPKGAYTVKVPIWGRMTASAMTEGTDIAVAAMIIPTTTIVTLTGTENGILTFITDRLREQNAQGVFQAIGQMHGNAMGRLLDTELVTLLDGFSMTAPGTTVKPTFKHLTGAVSRIRSTVNTTYGPAPSKPNAVLHPEQIRYMVQEVIGMQAAGTTMAAQPVPTGISQDVVKNYWRGNDAIFGIPIYEDGNITVASNDAKGGIFAKQALALAMEKEIKAEEQRDASLRGTEIVTTGIWGSVELVDPWGVELFSDVTPVFS